MNFKPKFSIGDKLKDKLTDLEGICVAICFYKTGCKRYAIQPKGIQADGSNNKVTWVDEVVIELINKEIEFEFNLEDIIKNKMFNLGDKVCHTVTNYKGICVAFVVRITGCRHYDIQAEGVNDKGGTKAWQEFSEVNLELINKGDAVKEVKHVSAEWDCAPSML